jgi:hypothetical protein
MTIKSAYQCQNRDCRVTLGWVLSRGERLKVREGVFAEDAGPVCLVRCPSCRAVRTFVALRDEAKQPNVPAKMVK